MVILQGVLGQQGLHSLSEQPGVQIDLLKHAQQVSQPCAERVKAAEDVLFAETEGGGKVLLMTRQTIF